MSLLSRAKLSGRIRLSCFQQLNSYSTLKTQKLTSPKSQKSSASSSNFSEGIKKPTGEVIVWPKPSEIPYQAKVANFVNLIGCVKGPIQFSTGSDGKHLAAILISQEISGGKDSLLIPAVFEGDLAHVVGCHVKENECVLVSGQLSSEPMHFDLGEGVGKFHVVGENLNLVEGFKRGVSRKNSISGVKKYWDEEDWGSRGEISVMKKKDGDLWRDVAKNSLLWWDYRDHKAKGLVKEKYPDFKHKESGDALWVNTAPKWMLQGLGKLEFDVQVIKPKLVQGGVRKNNGKDEDSWKDLVEYPFKWWDNRTDKRNPKAPDFKHKETGKGLWVSSSPDWALSRLPPRVAAF